MGGFLAALGKGLGAANKFLGKMHGMEGGYVQGTFSPYVDLFRPRRKQKPLTNLRRKFDPETGVLGEPEEEDYESLGTGTPSPGPRPTLYRPGERGFRFPTSKRRRIFF